MCAAYAARYAACRPPRTLPGRHVPDTPCRGAISRSAQQKLPAAKNSAHDCPRNINQELRSQRYGAAGGKKRRSPAATHRSQCSLADRRGTGDAAFSSHRHAPPQDPAWLSAGGSRATASRPLRPVTKGAAAQQRYQPANTPAADSRGTSRFGSCLVQRGSQGSIACIPCPGPCRTGFWAPTAVTCWSA